MSSLACMLFMIEKRILLNQQVQCKGVFVSYGVTSSIITRALNCWMTGQHGKRCKKAMMQGSGSRKQNSTSLSTYWLNAQPSNGRIFLRSEEHTSELQSRPHLVCRLLLEKKKKKK